MISRVKDASPVLTLTVPYSKLYKFATKTEKLLMLFGWLCATLTGFGLPANVFLLGNVINSFNQANAAEEMLKNVKEMAWIICIIGGATWILSFLYFYILSIFSQRVAQRTQVRYFEAILKQESAWFDTTNP